MSVPDINELPGSMADFKKDIDAVLAKYGIGTYSYSIKFGRNYFTEILPGFGSQKQFGVRKVVYPKRDKDS